MRMNEGGSQKFKPRRPYNWCVTVDLQGEARKDFDWPILTYGNRRNVTCPPTADNAVNTEERSKIRKGRIGDVAHVASARASRASVRASVAVASAAAKRVVRSVLSAMALRTSSSNSA